MKRVFDGRLEIAENGTIYFHLSNESDVLALGTETPMRIQGLGQLPELPLEIRVQRAVVNGDPVVDAWTDPLYHQTPTSDS